MSSARCEGGIHAQRDVVMGEQTHIYAAPQSTTIQTPPELAAELVKVQAQIVAEQISGRWQSGLPALSERRSALMIAAQALSDWAVGATPREPAQQAVQAALQSLEEADHGLGAR